jgi:hypothetical protein
VLIVYYLFKSKGNKPVKVIEFYPPEGISSAEVGTIIDSSVDAVDMASLIPWFAGQGYISIEEKEKGPVLKRTEVVLPPSFKLSLISDVYLFCTYTIALSFKISCS